MDSLSNEIADAIADSRCTFMVGAGISVNRRTGCPDWKSMVKGLISEIAADCIPRADHYVEHHLELLFNETFFQLMSQTLSEQQTVSAIKACLETREISNVHRFIAWCGNRFQTYVITTNFDELIELAGFANHGRPLLKLHGSLSNPESLRFRVNSVYAPLPPTTLREVSEYVGKRVLVVAGYSGLDYYDVMPSLFDAEQKPSRVIWIAHPGKSLDQRVKQRLETVDGLEIFERDVDEIFRNVLTLLAEKAIYRETTELILDWGQKEHCPDASWWVNNCKSWAAAIRDESPELLTLLWARLANHLRIYNVSIDGGNSNLADDAYEKLKQARSLIVRLEARIQAAYLGRINSMSQTAAEDLSTIISEINDDKLTNDVAVFELLGLAQHQAGVALQQKRDFLLADQMLVDAINTRERYDLNQLPFSEFQRYMNARVAFENETLINAHFVDLSWQSEFAEKLSGYVDEAREHYRMREYSLWLHNLAFIYQTMAEDSRRLGKSNDRIIELAIQSLSAYERAAQIREEMRDPRMIVQSLIRLAQIYLMLATRQQFTERPRAQQILDCKKYLDLAKRTAAKVARTYSEISKEEIRKGHLDALEQGFVDFEQKHFPAAYLDWMPIGPIYTTKQIDQEATALRANPSRGWHLAVVTAVLDRNGQVLMTRLGDYSRKRFGDNAWVLPGGSVESDELPSQAAVREVYEETGLVISPQSLEPVAWICRPNFKSHRSENTGELLILFGVKLGGNAPQVTCNPPETTASDWIRINLKAFSSGELQKRVGSVFPAHHIYWARLAQSELNIEGATTRFLFYHGSDMSFKPWLAIEKNQFEIESLFT